MRQRRPDGHTLGLLISLRRALAFEVRGLVDAPAVTNSGPEV